MKHKYKCPYCGMEAIKMYANLTQVICNECNSHSPIMRTLEESYKTWWKPFNALDILSKRIEQCACECPLGVFEVCPCKGNPNVKCNSYIVKWAMEENCEK